VRFVIEFYRDDDRGFLFHGLISTSQFIGLLTIVASVALFYYLRHRPAEAA
jgi:prolipoprotein diacylglyceryltransferase